MQGNEHFQDNRTKIWTIPNYFRVVLFLLLILALFSHKSADLAVLEGGMKDYTLLKNWLGLAGAHTARILFYLFGLAVYPMLGLMLIRLIRCFIPFKRREGNGCKGAFFAVLIAISVLFAMWPERFIDVTDTLGIGRIERPALALSGGIIGSKLAAPHCPGIAEAGLIRRYLGDIGTMIIAGLLMLPSLALLFYHDWFFLFADFWSDWKKDREYLRNQREARRQQRKEEAEREKEERKREKAARKSAVPNEAEDATAENGEEIWTPEPPQSQDGRTFEPQSAESASGPAPGEQDDSRVQTDDDDFNPVKAPQDAPYPSDTDDYVSQVIAPPPSRNGRKRMPGPVDVAYSDHYGEPPAQTPVYPPPAENREESSVRPAVSPVMAPSAPSAVRNSSVPSVHTYPQNREKYDHEHPDASEPDNRIVKGLGSKYNPYKLPTPEMLQWHEESNTQENEAFVRKEREQLQNTLDSFDVNGSVTEITVGPRVTQFEVSLAPGIKVEKVTGIQQNIAMELAAESLRMRAPIPGKNTIGIEVPNKVASTVYLRPLLESPAWKESRAAIPIVLGRDITGKVMVADLGRAPHMLIAGTTGSGKSVCMNSLIMSLLFRFTPDDLRLIMVDPKIVELANYAPLPHLMTPIVNEAKKVPLALRWGVNEMERRYRVMAKVLHKELKTFNNRPEDPRPVYDDDGNPVPKKMPLLIIIIDELADIMMIKDARADVETSISRIAAKGRAAGVHLIIATQSPRKDIITGTIKANLPTKIAFKVSSGIDSRVILDCIGAEKLLGNGDMLFTAGASGLERIQGSYVSDPEIQKVVEEISRGHEQHFDDGVVAERVESADEFVESNRDSSAASRRHGDDMEDDEDFGEDAPFEEDTSNHHSAQFINSVAAKYLQPGDGELMRKALEIIINEQQVSTSFLQRRLGIGYNKSADLIDKLEQRHIISAPLPGGQKRTILITEGLEVNEIE